METLIFFISTKGIHSNVMVGLLGLGNWAPGTGGTGWRDPVGTFRPGLVCLVIKRLHRNPLGKHSQGIRKQNRKTFELGHLRERPLFIGHTTQELKHGFLLIKFSKQPTADVIWQLVDLRETCPECLQNTCSQFVEAITRSVKDL